MNPGGHKISNVSGTKPRQEAEQTCARNRMPTGYCEIVKFYLGWEDR